MQTVRIVVHTVGVFAAVNTDRVGKLRADINTKVGVSLLSPSTLSTVSLPIKGSVYKESTENKFLNHFGLCFKRALLTSALAQLPLTTTITSSGEDTQWCTVGEMSASITPSESKRPWEAMGGAHSSSAHQQGKGSEIYCKITTDCIFVSDSACVCSAQLMCFIKSKFSPLPNIVLVIVLQHHDVDHICRCNVDNAIIHNCAKSYTSEAFFCIQLPGHTITVSAGIINHGIM